MTVLTGSVAVIGAALALAGYTYAGYPALLWVVAAFRRERPAGTRDREWPRISVTVPAYNEEETIAGALDAILEADYPADRRQVLVVSDASSDRTDEIVRSYTARGVELLRMPGRAGKTAAENAAADRLTGDFIINTDASVRVHPDAFRRLVEALDDPGVGVASSRDVSVGADGTEKNVGEARYVPYEMWVRRLETRVYGIVGASGSLYAVRSAVHRTKLPKNLSRDFVAALIARERGYRALLVDDAVCFVPRTPGLRREYARKVRTMSRGIATLFYKYRLLNPFRYGAFAWMLLSHKLCRWLVPWAFVAALAAALAAAPAHAWARWVVGMAGLAGAAAAAGWLWPETRRPPRVLALPAYLIAANLATLHAWGRAIAKWDGSAWEPTRRSASVGATRR